MKNKKINCQQTVIVFRISTTSKNKKNKMQKQRMLFLLIGGALSSHAGTMGNAPNPYAGFWAGVGGSYAYTTLDGQTNISQVDSAPSSAQYLLGNDILNHMAPVFNAGYYYPINSEWLVGPKFLYKYIGQQQFDETWSGTFQDGTFQSAGIKTKSVQNFNLLLSGAYKFSNWLVYSGAGLSWADVKVELNGSILPATSTVFNQVALSQNKYILGGAGQVGFEYMLPNRFMVDISYNFLATARTSIPNLRFNATNGGYSSFSQSLSVVEQGINITVNKYFTGL